MAEKNGPEGRPLVGITTSSFARFSREPLEALETAGYTWRMNPHGRKLTEEETVEVLSGCVGVVAGVEPLTRRVFAALPELRAVSRCGTGMDNVDFDAAADYGVRVTNTPYGPTQATAEMVLGMTLSMLRDIPAMDRDLRSGVWKKRMGRQLAGKRVGVVGLGKIGGRLAGMFAALGCEVKYSDPVVESAEFERLGLDDLLGGQRS
ncbi:NAD(P)-dependent oxidoreductase [Salidesulfovibrio brasiliensis]|uniref:NAD(P)-dependent oxidoreductase n=1 Tax=Salidesulfovibrio brasiliensis TaxID=221711 RepID=UPI000AC5309F